MWVLTRSRIKRGEVQLETSNPEIGHAHRRNKLADEDYQEEDEKDFHKVFYQMEDMVEFFFVDYQDRLEKKKTKKEKEENIALGKGGDPYGPSSSSSSERSSPASSNPKKQPKKAKFDLPYLKLDIKFDFPIHNGELNKEN